MQCRLENEPNHPAFARAPEGFPGGLSRCCSSSTPAPPLRLHRGPCWQPQPQPSSWGHSTGWIHRGLLAFTLPVPSTANSCPKSLSQRLLSRFAKAEKDLGSPCPAPAGGAARPQPWQPAGSRWHSCLGVIVSRQGQRVQQFQQAEDILPRFLVDYCRNLEAFEFTLRASEDAVRVEVPLRLDGDALRVSPCQPGKLGTCHLEVPSAVTGVEDWTSAGDMERGSGTARHLAPGKVLQHLKELLVSAIVHCQRRFLLQPGVYGTGARPRLGAGSPLRKGTLNAPCHAHPSLGAGMGMLLLLVLPISTGNWRLLWAVDTLQGPRLDSLRLLEQLSSQDWREEDGSTGLSFDHLKVGQVLAAARSCFPRQEDWQDLEGSVYRLLVNLFHGEPLDLASLQQKVEAFAQDPPRFLRFHFGHPASTKGLQADPELRALLRLPDGDRAYWDTAYFDIPAQPGNSQPAPAAALQGIAQGPEHTVHVVFGRVVAHEADSQDLGGEGRVSPCRIHPGLCPASTGSHRAWGVRGAPRFFLFITLSHGKDV
uniref:Uncharacterized protein n=1 Tax=Anas platyrhynchos TaxID=8839 RepID=A0A8B9TSB4_ANAPL